METQISNKRITQDATLVGQFCKIVGEFTTNDTEIKSFDGTVHDKAEVNPAPDSMNMHAHMPAINEGTVKYSVSESGSITKTTNGIKAEWADEVDSMFAQFISDIKRELTPITVGEV